MRKTLVIIRDRVEKMFGLDEVRQSRALHLVAILLLLGWFLEFSTWMSVSDFTVNAVSEGRHLCWPFFQSCGEWYFLAQQPLGVSHGVFYAVLFGLLVGAGYALIVRRYDLFFAIAMVFLAVEILVMALSMRLSVNYWYFHLLAAAIFLFSRDRLWYLRVGMVLLYFFSGILKLDEAWLQGKYFYALADGLYLVPDALIPIATNAVIVLELILVWFLFSSRRNVRLTVLALLTLLHVYSSLYVGYLYPTIALPMMLVLFWCDEWPQKSFRARVRDYGGMAIIALLLVIHMIPYAITGEARFTGEGNRFGMYMFEANYQCRSRATLVHASGIPEDLFSESTAANVRCDPYAHYFYFKQLCAREHGARVVDWTYDASLNGNAFARIVDEKDACTLSYLAFKHNAWIKLPNDPALIMLEVPPRNHYELSR